jgi:hypothetical protein
VSPQNGVGPTIRVVLPQTIRYLADSITLEAPIFHEPDLGAQ